MENIDEDIKDLNKYISFSKKSENFSHNTDYEWHKELGEKIENLLSRLKTAERMNDELIKLRTALQKEYDCAMEGFMKKQISTSVVDGTIAQETGWILNELDKILGNGQERR